MTIEQLIDGAILKSDSRSGYKNACPGAVWTNPGSKVVVLPQSGHGQSEVIASNNCESRAQVDNMAWQHYFKSTSSHNYGPFLSLKV